MLLTSFAPRHAESHRTDSLCALSRGWKDPTWNEVVAIAHHTAVSYGNAAESYFKYVHPHDYPLFHASNAHTHVPACMAPAQEEGLLILLIRRRAAAAPACGALCTTAAGAAFVTPGALSLSWSGHRASCGAHSTASCTHSRG